MPPRSNPATRVSAGDRDERPGSIFNELIVLPTLAPRLARPEYLASYQPGVPIPLPQPRSQQRQEGVLAVIPAPPPQDGLSSSQASSDDDGGFPEPPCSQPRRSALDENDYEQPEPTAGSESSAGNNAARLFFVNIVTTKTLPAIRSANGRGAVKAPTKTSPISVVIPGQVAVLDLSRIH
ncbi:hypothetical protein PM082_007328 [Marasmius tenuissimus]|nr:hypothetical protein PM082_007328 [Marasmius tenuissimus]